MRSLLLYASLATAACSFPDYGYGVARQGAHNLCEDNALSPGESDVDCGGTCVTCANGRSCSTNTDCASAYCLRGTCSVATCSDGARNQTETDIDCGGADGCPPCPTGKRCETSRDCDAALCAAGKCLPQSCSDGLQNQTETDIDCGGESGCDRCYSRQHCAKDGDCDIGRCLQGRCQPPTCADGLKSGDETGVDCGGSCAPCSTSAGCTTGQDCASAICNATSGSCAEPSCSDGAKNGGEGGVDCGSACPNQCSLTSDCSVGADCSSGVCSSARCVPAGATGAQLSTVGWLATASATADSSAAPALAIDGKQWTHWMSGTGQVPGMWFEIDMQREQVFYALNLIQTSHPTDYPQALRVLVSDDGQNFVAITSTVAGKPELHIDFSSPRIARYLKLELTQDTDGVWWRIDELQILQ